MEVSEHKSRVDKPESVAHPQPSSMMNSSLFQAEGKTNSKVLRSGKTSSIQRPANISTVKAQYIRWVMSA